jgi:hypothetical protein
MTADDASSQGNGPNEQARELLAASHIYDGSGNRRATLSAESIARAGAGEGTFVILLAGLFGRAPSARARMDLSPGGIGAGTRNEYRVPGRLHTSLDTGETPVIPALWSPVSWRCGSRQGRHLLRCAQSPASAGGPQASAASFGAALGTNPVAVHPTPSLR